MGVRRRDRGVRDGGTTVREGDARRWYRERKGRRDEGRSDRTPGKVSSDSPETFDGQRNEVRKRSLKGLERVMNF